MREKLGKEKLETMEQREEIGGRHLVHFQVNSL